MFVKAFVKAFVKTFVKMFVKAFVKVFVKMFARCCIPATIRAASHGKLNWSASINKLIN